MKPYLRGLMLGLTALVAQSATAAVIDFQDLSLAAESFYNGADLAGGFTSNGADFNNSFTDWGGGFTSWGGFAYSNTTDSTTAGFGNQHSAFASSNQDGSSIYGVSFGSSSGEATIDLNGNGPPLTIDITNTTYAALSMRDGDSFAKKFGGASGFDPDYFLLTIFGLDGNGNTVGSVPFYLADFRSANSAQDYIVSDWTTVDISALSTAVQLTFSLTSSDNDPLFGMNTPGYFAVDNIVTAEVVPEASSFALGGVALVAGLVLRRKSKAA